MYQVTLFEFFIWKRAASWATLIGEFIHVQLSKVVHQLVAAGWRTSYWPVADK